MARFPHFCLSLLVCMDFSDSPLSATPADVDENGQTNPFYQLQISSNGLVTLLGTGTGTGIGTNRKYSMLWKCSHWLEIGNGTRAYCFLLCQSPSLYRSCARSREVWVYHNRVIFWKKTRTENKEIQLFSKFLLKCVHRSFLLRTKRARTNCPKLAFYQNYPNDDKRLHTEENLFLLLLIYINGKVKGCVVHN